VFLSALLLLTIAVAVRHWRQITAADFRLADLTGKPQRLHDQRGKVVLLNFWATWCAPCVTELPDLQRLHPLSQTQPFVLWTVNLQEHPSVVAQFMQMYRLDFPVLLDTEGMVAEGYGVRQIPTTFLIDCGGTIAATLVGVWNSTAQQTLSRLLEKAQQDERCVPG
jgi:peroxiredoxin